MRISINTRVLQKALGKVSSVINPNSLIPVLSNVKINLEGNKMTLTGSDTGTTISRILQIGTEGNVGFCVGAKLLLDLIKTLPNEDIVMDIDSMLVVTSTKGKFQFPIVDDAEYPVPASFEPTENVVIKGFVLDTVLSSTKDAVSEEELRPTMGGVCFDFKEEGAVFVATNGFKLEKYTTKIKGAGSNIIVPPFVFQSVLGLQDEDVSIMFNDRNITFKYRENNEDVVVIGRLLEGKYPPYDKVIPSGHPQHSIVDNAEISEAIKRASLFSPEGSREITLTFESGKIKVDANNINYSTGSAQVVRAETNGDASIKFNSAYLLDVLKKAGVGNVKISYGPESHAVLVQNSASPGLLGLVMSLQS